MTEEAAPKKAQQINYGKAGGTVPPTSGDAKPEREPVKQIIDPSEMKRKRSLGRKLRENFGGEDLKTVAFHVATDVLLPKAKEMVVDSLFEGIHRSFYGSSRGYQGGQNQGDRSRGTNYNRMYVSPNKGFATGTPQQPNQPVAPSIGPNDYLDFVFPDRGRAEETLDQMIELVSHYGTVSVHELKQMLGFTGEFTDQKWGWKALGSASVERERDGYRLALPKVVSLD